MSSTHIAVSFITQDACHIIQYNIMICYVQLQSQIPTQLIGFDQVISCAHLARLRLRAQRGNV